MKAAIICHALHGMFYLVALLTAIIVGAGTIVDSSAGAAAPIVRAD